MTSDTPRLFRLNLEVGDVEAAAAFYGTLFGAEPRPQPGARIYLAAGPVILQIVQLPAPHPAAKALYFAVADLDAVHARAEDLGCLATGDVHGTPAGMPWTSSRERQSSEAARACSASRSATAK
jgi:predicted enzyme related to lactoylglutathione lyase